MLNHSPEWDVMMTTGELFPNIEPQAIRKITVPVLPLSGEKSYPFLRLIDEELEHLLPKSRRIVLRGATHRMWFEQSELCRKAVLDFWREQASVPRPYSPGSGLFVVNSDDLQTRSELRFLPTLRLAPRAQVESLSQVAR